MYYINEGVCNPLLEYKYIEMQSEIVGTFEEPEEEELVVVDKRIDEISKIRADQKSKETLAKEIYIMIDGDEYTLKDDPLPNDEEALTRMIEMSKGYLLTEIVEYPIKIEGDTYYIIETIISKNFIKCAEYLFDYCGVDVNFIKLIDIAIAHDHFDMILLLLNRGAKITQYNLGKIRSFHTLKEVITFLIQNRNVDINEYKNLLSKSLKSQKELDEDAGAPSGTFPPQ